MTVEPLHDRILVERLPEPEGLIVLTDRAKPKICKVLAVGPGRWIDGVFTKTAVKPGDVVLIPGYGGEHPDYECDDGTFLIQMQDVGAIIDAPLIGTFEPKLGDLGRDADNNLWAWDGSRWINSKGQPAKTFNEWMGFDG